MDLRHRTFPEAMELAKLKSGMDNEQIARGLALRLGRATPYPASTVQGWFNLDRQYWPSVVILPALCGVLGNTIPIDWLVEQVRVAPACTPDMIPAGIADCLPGLIAQFGRVGQEVGETMDDGAISPREAREILDASEGLRAQLDRLQAMLGPLAERAKRR